MTTHWAVTTIAELIRQLDHANARNGGLVAANYKLRKELAAYKADAPDPVAVALMDPELNRLRNLLAVLRLDADGNCFVIAGVLRACARIVETVERETWRKTA